jgi:hypothetical protein
MQDSLTEYSHDNLKIIHDLSRQYNRKVGVVHQDRLLDLMKKHVVEIEELLASNDSHALVETGDLLILCFEMLIEHGCSSDKILDQCYGRYKNKLKELMNEEEER